MPGSAACRCLTFPNCAEAISLRQLAIAIRPEEKPKDPLPDSTQCETSLVPLPIIPSAQRYREVILAKTLSMPMPGHRPLPIDRPMEAAARPSGKNTFGNLMGRAVAVARQRPGLVLAWVLGLHLIVWTLLPILLCPNLQLDLVEDLAI